MESSKNKQYINCKPWQLLLWPLHSTCSNFLYILMMFAGYIATGGYGILVATAGMIATGTRLFDGIIDPFIALITDRINSKYGRVRILIILGRGIQCISVIAMFFWGIGHGAIVYTLIYSIYIVGGTISSIATHTGNPVLTTNPKQRPKIFRWQMIYSTTIGALFQMYLSKVLVPKYGGMKLEMFQEMCVLVVVLVVIFEIIAMIGISSVDKPENFAKKKGSKDVGIKDTWSLLKGNRALQMYIFSGVSDKIASQAASQAAVVTLVYGIVIANYQFSGTVSAYSIIPNLLLLVVGTQFMSKIGTKKSLIIWTTASLGIAMIIIAFMALVDTKSISVSPILTTTFIILILAYGAAKNMTSACTNAMVPDIVDYELYRSGKFIPGAVGTLYSFVDEMTSSISNTIVGLSLASVGFITAQPKPGDPLTQRIFWMTMILWMGMPILGWVVTLVSMKWYPLDKAKMEEIQLHNYELRKSIKSAEEEIAIEA